MKVIFLASSIVGTKTSNAVRYASNIYKKKMSTDDIEIIDLKEKKIEFSDGRNYLDYSSDTLELTKKLMQADAIVIGTPIFQSSIPGTLKNVFDLLPPNAFRDKIVGIIATAGTENHFLIPEYQLKPIINYMKGYNLPNYVFIHDSDFNQGDIINHDIKLRVEKLMDDLVIIGNTYKQVNALANESFDF